MVTVVTKYIGSTGDYSSLTAWEAATDNNLVSLDEQHDGVVQNETVTDTAAVTCTGATVDTTRYRRLVATGGSEYDPAADTGSKLANSAGVLTISEPSFIVEDLGIEQTQTASRTVLALAESNLVTGTHSNIILRRCGIENNTSSSGGTGLYLSGNASQVYQTHGIEAYNNFIFNRTAVGGTYAITTPGVKVDEGLTWVVANNTCWGFNFQTGTTGGNQITLTNVTTGTNSTNTFIFANNVSMDGASLGNAYSSFSASTFSTNIANVTVDYNAGFDTSAPGANSVDNLTSGDFADITSDDYDIASSGSALESAGTSLSSYFTDDFYGNTRTGDWDIGAVQLVGAPATNLSGSLINSGAAVSSGSITYALVLSGSLINELAAISAGVANIGLQGALAAAAATQTAGSIQAGAGTTNLDGALTSAAAAVSDGTISVELNGALATAPATVLTGSVSFGTVLAGGLTASLAAVLSGSINTGGSLSGALTAAPATVLGGTISVGMAGALASAAATVLSGTAAASINLSGAALDSKGGVFGGDINVGMAGTVVDETAAVLTGAIQAAGALAMTGTVIDSTAATQGGSITYGLVLSGALTSVLATILDGTVAWETKLSGDQATAPATVLGGSISGLGANIELTGGLTAAAATMLAGALASDSVLLGGSLINTKTEMLGGTVTWDYLLNGALAAAPATFQEGVMGGILYEGIHIRGSVQLDDEVRGSVEVNNDYYSLNLW